MEDRGSIAEILSGLGISQERLVHCFNDTKGQSL